MTTPVILAVVGILAALAPLGWAWPAAQRTGVRLQFLASSAATLGLFATLVAAAVAGPAGLAAQAAGPWLLVLAPLFCGGICRLALVGLAAQVPEDLAAVQQAARSLAMAGKFLGEAVEPFRDAADRLAAGMEQLDASAVTARMTAAADSFGARLEAGAASLVAAAQGLAPQVAAVQSGGAALADASERIKVAFDGVEQGLHGLATALEPARDAAAKMSDSLDALTTAHDQLATTGAVLGDVLRKIEESQQPLAESMTLASRGLGEATKDFDHLITQLNANQDVVADNLNQVRQRLDSAAGRIEQATAEWGTLVRSGLAASHEFSRQAIEALLTGLEQSPPDFGAVSEAARESAAAATAMSRTLETSIQTFQSGVQGSVERVAQLTAALEQRLQTAVAGMSGSDLKQLASTVGELRTTLGQLQQTVDNLGRNVTAGSGLGRLAEEMKEFRLALVAAPPAGAPAGPVSGGDADAPAAKVPPAWVAGAAVVGLYVLYCLGAAAGLLPRLHGR